MLPETAQLLLFAGSAILLLVTPGPAVLYVVTRSAEQGRIAGICSALGLVAGGAVHVAAAALGLSALLVSSPALFTAVQLAGAAYLVFLGIRTLAERPADATAASSLRAPRTLGRLLVDGLVVNLLNPKAALFFLAFLPQFTDPARGSMPLQILSLGGLFLVLALASDTAFALAAGSLAPWFRAHPHRLRARRWVTGAVYLGLGVAAAVGSRFR